jgi:hypothetical protein
MKSFSVLFTKLFHSQSNLLLEKFVLEFLFTKNLLRFLTSSNEVRHHFFCRAKEQVFMYFVVLKCQFRSDLVGEAFELAEANSIMSNVVLENQFLCQLNGVKIMRSNCNHASSIEIFDNELGSIVVALVGFFE